MHQSRTSGFFRIFRSPLVVTGLFFCTTAFFSCAVLFSLFSGTEVSAQSTASQQAALEAQLNDVLAQIAAQEKILAAEQNKGASLQRDINILTDQIKTAQLKIQAKNLAIAALGKDISQKTQIITTLTGKINQNHTLLGQLLRGTQQVDDVTLADLMLGEQTLSGFFLDADQSDVFKQAVNVAVNEIKVDKSSTEQARKQLSEKQVAETNAKISIQEEQAKIKKNEAQKATLLNLSKTQQKNYKSVLSQQQAKAAAIRTALFALRDTGSIQFGTALEYANQVSAQTGIRPAFLLAILTQESNLGKNVGSCYITDFVTGDGVRVSTGAAVSGIMKPSRDIQPFLAITASVGRNPSQTRVSCPFSTGYGGAMGPAQFIPSTWKLFESRIKNALGVATADPWNARDAFTASALYLTDLGAKSGNASSERNAACRYYSGRSCDNKSPANTFYGDQVIAKAIDIQVNMIDPLKGQ